VPEAAGALVPPEDVPALAAALARLLTDAAAREAASVAARQAAARLPRWEETVDRVLALLRRLV
jgi:glycosyltransferase involved in cell wall biosynthesis